MATEVRLPDIGEGVTEGELVSWLVKPGDTVAADQPVAEVLTDKATVEVPSPYAGVVQELKASEGDIVPIENVLLTLSEGASAAAKPAAATAAAAETPAASAAPAASNGSSYEVKLPDIGEGVTEGELVSWLVKPGDSVAADQPVAEVLTDKATVEVPSPVAGTVKELKASEGDVIPIESVILVLSGSAGTTAAAPKAETAAAPAATASAPAPISNGSASMGQVHPPVASSKVLATPSTRRLARELSVDINNVKGTGLAGRVTREDVLKSKGSSATSSSGAQAPTSVPRPSYSSPEGAVEERVALRGIRRKIAENMQMTKQIVPHFTIMDEANVTQLVRFREQTKEMAKAKGVKVTYLPFIMKALIATLREYPAANASIDDAAQEIVYKKYFNIGFAADTPQGLVVPVIKDADRKSILELSAEIYDLASRARDGKLKPDEMKGATITITNIGSVGGTYATPIINHPEVAILGVYKITDKPVIANGKWRNSKSMNYTLTCDHRLIDGALAARLLNSFIQRIENPATLMLDMM